MQWGAARAALLSCPCLSTPLLSSPGLHYDSLDRSSPPREAEHRRKHGFFSPGETVTVLCDLFARSDDKLLTYLGVAVQCFCRRACLNTAHHSRCKRLPSSQSFTSTASSALDVCVCVHPRHPSHPRVCVYINRWLRG